MAAQESMVVVTPLSRLVRGSMTERSKENYEGVAYEENKGPFELAIAVPKSDAGTPILLGKIYNQAVAGYAANPNMKQRIDSEWTNGFTLGTFRFKVRDGDKPNQEGNLNANTAGCWVIYASSYIPFKTSYTNGYGLPIFKDAKGVDIAPMNEIDRNLIKIGDYVHVSLGVKINEKLDQTAGVYMNINGVILGAMGEAITGGISLDTAFAGLQLSAALPNGATVAALPGLPAPGGNVAPATVAALPVPGGVSAGPVALPTASPTANVQPHVGFLAGPGGGAAPGVGLPLPGQ